MSGEEPSETLKILLEVKKQMAELEGKVDSIQCARTSSSFDVDPEETEDSAGKLVELSEETSAFLEAAFSTTLSNADHRKRIAQIGIPDCDKIRCPKLDPMLATVLPKDAIKVDGYLSRLQQFWLDVVAPLTAILEGSDVGELTPEQAYAATQSALCLLGNAKNHGARKVQEGLNERQPRLEIYGGGGKCVPAGSTDAIWREIRKESHGQSGSSKGHKEDNLFKARENR